MLYASTNAAVNFGESYVLELVGLALVVVFVVRKVVPPLRRAMNAQSESIRTQLASGDEMRAAAERVVAERKAALDAARAEAARIVEQARSSAEQIVEDGRRRGDEEHQRLVARAATEIELTRARVREDVSSQFALLVIEAAEAVVEAELNVEIHHHLIAEAIAAAESEVA